MKPKVWITNNSVRIQRNLEGTKFSLAPNSTSFPGLDYFSWGDTHDSIKFKGSTRNIAIWDDNGGPTSEMLLLYIKTTTADIRILRDYKVFEPIPPALIINSVRVVFNGNTTVYNDYTEQNLVYNLGENCNLTLQLFNGCCGGGFYDMKISFDDIPNLLEIGGGIAAVMRTIALNSAEGTGKPSIWHGGSGKDANGFNNLTPLSNGSTINKSDFIAAANSSPGNSAWDKVSFSWSPSGEFGALVRHSKNSISRSKATFSVSISASNDLLTITEFNDRPINNYTGSNFNTINDGSPICFTQITSNGLILGTTYYIKSVNKGTPITFKLVPNLGDETPDVDILSNGTGKFQIGWCSHIDCDFCDENLINSLSSSGDGTGYDPTFPAWLLP